MKNIKVKTRHDWCMPKAAHNGEWLDLATSEHVSLKAGESMNIDLGVCIELPEGYEAILAARSSTFKKYGLIQVNGIGVIDNAYCGDNDWWTENVLATRDIEIEPGMRICQFRLQKIQEDVEIEAVEHLGNPDRGGCGSTGN